VISAIVLVLLCPAVVSGIGTTLQCAPPVLEVENGAQWLPGEVASLVPKVEELCRRRYSPDHCPVRLLKRGTLRYSVVCRKK
jgi:hypothetical protein